MSGLGVRVFHLLFDKEQDADVIERMEMQPFTMTSYVCDLVRRDMHDGRLRKAVTDLLAENAKLRELVVLWSVINKHMSLCATTDCGQCPVREECGESVYLEGLLGIDPKGLSWRVQERMAEATDVQAENAKLRELLSSYWKRTHSPVGPSVERDYLQELRELGVEVSQ